MGYGLKRFLLGTITALFVIGVWLWSTAEDFEYQEAEKNWTVPDRFQPPKPEVKEEDEVDYVVKEPPPNYGWVYPPKPVRKAVGKIKKKIKPKKQ